MDSFFFSSALNIHTVQTDRKVLRWAWNRGLFENPAELERCRQQKINWFAGFLFPVSHEDRLLEIMKFFLSLFLLDDLMEVKADKDLLRYLDGLKNPVRLVSTDRLDRLSCALIDLKGSLSNHFTKKEEVIEWEEAWHSYLDGLLWEMKNKIDKRLPGLQEYRYLRPFASGVYLAILLARDKGHPKECKTELLEFEISRFICLANDISSFEKEYSVGEFHNEVFIQSQFMGKDAMISAKKDLQMIGRRIITLSQMIEPNLKFCGDWIRRLHLLVGGCLAWSELSTRYQAHVNGKSTPHR